jgi:predicted  nucleic acid-binding Zn-ribbon protein
MFTLGDYTLEEVAIQFDCTGRGMKEVLADLKIARRQYWLFGPVLYSKATIDDLAPTMRAMMQQMGATRADVAAREQELQRTRQQIEAHKESIAATEQQMKDKREDFFQRMQAIIEKQEGK